MHKTRTRQEQFIKFALVGISGTIIDFSIFNIFLFLKFNSLISGSISFLIAVFNNFYWNRKWTYPESMKFPLKEQLFKFFIVSLCGLIIRNLLYNNIEKSSILLAENIFPSNGFVAPAVLGQNLSLAIVIFIVLLWNFFINRIWTYKKSS
jgi:putative flippase GtrA